MHPAGSLFVITPQGYSLLPQLVAAIGPLDVEPHRVLGSQVDFYTATPLAEMPHESTGALP
jgi:hypothetical protein